MKLAIPYSDGNVYEHFGKAAQFIIYEIEDGEVVSDEIVETACEGHEAVAGFLSEAGVDVVIAGNMGEGAGNALVAAGITVFTGASGNTDDVVAGFLEGDISSEGCNCGGGEGGCGGSCGSSCGGGCGGCHSAPTILYEGKNAGKVCRVHYRGTFNDGTEFDSSYNRNEPLEFTCGIGMMIAGFDKAVVNMEPGETVDIHLTPDEAYGQADPQAIFTVTISELPGAEELELNDQAYLTNTYGQPFKVRVIAKTPETITFDANHEMAGKELNFNITLVDVK